MPGLRQTAVWLGFMFGSCRAAFADTQTLFVLGQITNVKETKIHAPYDSDLDGQRFYARGDVFDRWVWKRSAPVITAEAIEIVGTPEQYAGLSLSLNVPRSLFVKEGNYDLIVSSDIKCDNTQKNGGIHGPAWAACWVRVDIRCYNYVEGNWQQTYRYLDEIYFDRDDSIEVSLGDISVTQSQCSRGMEIGIQSEIASGVRFGFKNFKFGIFEHF